MFSINNKEQLCLGDEPLQYDLKRSAKIDLCLNEVYDFLKRRKGTTKRLEIFLNGKNKNIKEQLFKKHRLLYLNEPSSLIDGIDSFYSGIDRFLFTFSELLTKYPNYPTKVFRITDDFYSELNKLKSSEKIINEVFFYDTLNDESERLVRVRKFVELIWEIYRDGKHFGFGIERVKKKGRKISKAKVIDIFTKEPYI